MISDYYSIWHEFNVHICVKSGCHIEIILSSEFHNNKKKKRSVIRQKQDVTSRVNVIGGWRYNEILVCTFSSSRSENAQEN